MPVIVKITTHEADARTRLIHQRHGQPRIEGLLNAFTGQIQQLEDYVFPLTALLDIDTMVGAQLDGIASIVGLERQGEADAAFRGAIRSQIFRRLNSGTPDQVIDAFRELTGSTLASIDYQEDYPAGVCIWGDGTFPVNLYDLMKPAVPAGVYFCGLELLITEDGLDGIITEDTSEGIYLRYYTVGR